MTDWALLKQYVESGSDKAFERIVKRHTAVVYSSALRRVGNHHLAEDVTQAVFILLAEKASGCCAVVAWVSALVFLWSGGKVVVGEAARKE